uniref:Uncharacterized protein n=1 Tax=Anopheles albimanus TaxID=7167 RepID=A0A182FXZ8_ANOAL
NEASGSNSTASTAERRHSPQTTLEPCTCDPCCVYGCRTKRRPRLRPCVFIVLTRLRTRTRWNIDAVVVVVVVVVGAYCSDHSDATTTKTLNKCVRRQRAESGA